MGQQVAAKGATVHDGTIQSRRGSLSIDDEGTPTNRTTLIEDGILVGTRRPPERTADKYEGHRQRKARLRLCRCRA